MTRAERKKIFIVEDQRIIAADLEKTLLKLGYEVAGTAPTGEGAVERATATRPDLVLMDIRLRGDMDGIQAAAAIRRHLDVPIVYLTAYADEETIVRARTTGASGYVVKPFNERELHAAIEVAIYKHDMERALVEERARRQTAEEFRLLVESVKDYAICKLDPQGRVVTWNVGAERIAGYTADEIVGQPSAIFYPPADVQEDKPRRVLETAREQGRVEDEGWRTRKDGSRYWASSAITALRDDGGRLLGYAVVVRDLSEQKRREDTERFLDHAMVALTSSLDIAETLDRAVHLVVPDLADWCLIDLADERGHLMQAAAAHVEPDKESLARRLGRDIPPQSDLSYGARHVFRTGKTDLHPAIDDVEWAAHLLGAEYPELLRQLGVVSYLCVPIPFRGETLGVINLLRSAPPRRYTADDVDIAEELARRAGIAIENAKLYRAAQDAIQARDEFLQVASHELKTPLMPLQIQLDTLARALARAGVQDERLASKLEMATRQTTRLADLVERLLDVSRITAGRLSLNLDDIDFSQVVRDVAERLRDDAAAAKCALVVRAHGPVVGRGDRLRIEQLVGHLLSNAIKYGAGHPVEVDVHDRGGEVEVRVRDHGIGVEPAALGRIFHRFERAAPVRQYGGLGLGLFIARQIAEAHGGKLAAESRPGQGATFTALLPREPSPAAEAAPTGGGAGAA